MEEIKLFADKVMVVKGKLTDLKTTSGIVIPVTEIEKDPSYPRIGRIVGVGPDVKSLKEEDLVMYSFLSGTAMTINDVAHMMLREYDIIGKVKKNGVKTEIELLSDRILVKVINHTDENRPSGIIVPDYILNNSDNYPCFGEVMFAGPGNDRHIADFKPGDKVIYNKYSAVNLKIDGEDLVLMRHFDCYARVHKKSSIILSK